MNVRRTLKYWLYNYCPGVAGRFPYYGTRVHFPPGAMLFGAICQQGSFEPEIIDRLVRLARPHATVVDVGANIGLMAIPVLSSRPTCRVVSFEPSPSSLPFLQRTARESTYRDRWVVIGKGLSHRCGEMDFVVGRPEDGPYEGFKSEDRIAGARVVKVPVSTLDEEWHQLCEPDVSVVKIDVEGAEGFVLQGGMELFSACHPVVIIEWHEPYLQRFGTSADQLLSFARNSGYRIYTVPGGVPVDEEQTLHVQMMSCSNFLLLH
jgi:FkbM family methyltransferase